MRVHRRLLALLCTLLFAPVASAQLRIEPKDLRWLSSKAPSVVDMYHAWRTLDEADRASDLRFDLSWVIMPGDVVVPTVQGEFDDATPIFLSASLRFLLDLGDHLVRFGVTVRLLNIDISSTANGDPELEEQLPDTGVTSLVAGGGYLWQSPTAPWHRWGFGAAVVWDTTPSTTPGPDGELFGTLQVDDDGNPVDSPETALALLEARAPFVDALVLLSGDGVEEAKIRTPIPGLKGLIGGPFAAAVDDLEGTQVGGYLTRWDLTDFLRVRGEPLALRTADGVEYDHSFAELVVHGSPGGAIQQVEVGVAASRTTHLGGSLDGFRLRGRMGFGGFHAEIGAGQNYYEDLLFMAIPEETLIRLAVGVSLAGYARGKKQDTSRAVQRRGRRRR